MLEVRIEEAFLQHAFLTEKQLLEIIDRDGIQVLVRRGDIKEVVFANFHGVSRLYFSEQTKWMSSFVN